MAASDHLHHEQLRLFVQAKELMDYPTFEGVNDDTPTTLRSDSRLYSQKLEESKTGPAYYTHGYGLPKGQTTLYQSVSKKGVEEPILLTFNRRLQRSTIDNGHHRIATANDINPEMYLSVRYVL